MPPIEAPRPFISDHAEQGGTLVTRLPYFIFGRPQEGSTDAGTSKLSTDHQEIEIVALPS